MTNIKKLLMLLFCLSILAAVIITASASFSCASQSYSGQIETITIGTNPIELNALIYVAEEFGFFQSQGIHIAYNNYDTGVAAVNGLLKGEADIAMTTEFVIVGNVFQKKDILDIATINKSILFHIVAGPDSGLKKVTDLKGKRIGVPRKTIMEFYLSRTLELNGISLQDITLVDTPAADPVGALKGGGIDAVVTWASYVTTIKQQLGNEVLTWPVQSDQKSFWSAVGTSAWIKQNPDLIKRFFKALVQAENIVNTKDHEARAIVKKRLNFTDAYIDDIWPQNQFLLSLDQSLILAMEDEARWMISNSMTSDETMPNLMKYIYTDGLKSVSPNAVSIIGK